MYEVFFTGKVDHRFAWLGNDALGSVDLLARLLTELDTATTSIELSTMTFSYDPSASGPSATVGAIAAKLAEKAQAGVRVRIMGNAGHRFQAGYLRAMHGPVQLADQNLPALVKRVSFQSSTTAPPGWLVDRGDAYGPRTGGETYGWDADMTTRVKAHGGPSTPPSFTSPILREAYAAPNDADGHEREWSIQLEPNSWYAVRVFCGLPSEATDNNVKAQGRMIFAKPDSSGDFLFYYHLDADAGEFVVSSVDGGTDDANGPRAQRVQTGADGKLTLQVGYQLLSQKTALAAVEIYRWSPTAADGDDFTDHRLVQRRGIHHAKFAIIDGARVWTGSHNITPVDVTDPHARSEDALLTDEASVVAAFRAEFDTWWGTSSLAPDPAASRTLVFKPPVLLDTTVHNPQLGESFPWKLRFHPSTNVPPSTPPPSSASGPLDIRQFLASHLDGVGDEVLLLLEQLTVSGTFSSTYGNYGGSTSLINALETLGSAGIRIHGLLGNRSGDPVWTEFGGTNVDVGASSRVHDKAVLVDALRDNPTRRQGRVLFGSSNWSQGAMHTNHEQTFIVEDPELANSYLQRAAAAFTEDGNPLEREIDCVLVVDRSYSMNDRLSDGTTSKLDLAKRAAGVFIDVLHHDLRHRVALSRFGTVAEAFVPPQVLTPLDGTSASTLVGLVDGIQASLPIASSTSYGSGLADAWSKLTAVTSPKSRRLVVFLTDGKQNAAPMADTVWPSMASEGIELHTTSFGVPSTDATGANAILHEMALGSGGSFAQVDTTLTGLQKRFADVARDALGMVTYLDPSLRLQPGQVVQSPVHVDVARGRLVFVWLWSRGALPVEVALRLPSGSILRSGHPAVAQRLRAGHIVWHVELAKLVKEDPQGTWVVHTQCHHQQIGASQAELMVFGPGPQADADAAHLQAELHAVKGGAVLRVRGWAQGEPVSLDALEVTWAPPGSSNARGLTPVPLSPIDPKARRWRGVFEAKLDPRPGVHRVHVVLQAKGRRGLVRREQSVSFVVGQRDFRPLRPLAGRRIQRWPR
ncbi:MAG: VWA domain-containing protein [Myxococcales bacterium]|nr:VWA domain-containing protein [Myxococcales bacterium]